MTMVEGWGGQGMTYLEMKAHHEALRRDEEDELIRLSSNVGSAPDDEYVERHARRAAIFATWRARKDLRRSAWRAEAGITGSIAFLRTAAECQLGEEGR